MKYPKWAMKYKKKGTELRKIGNNFYLYKVTSVWDKKKKKTRKVTRKYLGAVKKEGLIKPKYERVMECTKNVTIKKFGATNLISEMNDDIKKELIQIYPVRWKEIFTFSIFRLLYNSPIKNLQEYYTASFISETIPNAHLSPKKIGNLLREIGKERGRIKLFLREFISGSDFLLIDLTHVFSFSRNVISSVPGYNSKRDFRPQIHMVFLFSLDQHMPSYFRIVPGSVCDVSSLVLTVKEAEIENAVLIGDKGFYSEDNVISLDGEKLHYVLPLRRDSSLIKYDKIKKGNKEKFDGHLLFENRLIWYYSYKLKHDNLKGKRIVVFLDEKLKTEQERDYISRIGEEKSTNTIQEFFKIQHRQGTISVITDLNEDGEKIYSLLKTRAEIETMIDAFKNVLNADRTYMRGDHQMEGWMFVNFISLIFYYRLYKVLVNKKLLKKYTPKDILIHLSRVYKLKIQDHWEISEVPKKTRKILEKLDRPIT